MAVTETSYRYAGRLTERLAVTETHYRHAGRLTERLAVTETNRHADIYTDRQSGRQTISPTSPSILFSTANVSTCTHCHQWLGADW